VLIASPPDEESGRLELVTAIYDATEWMNRLIADLLDVSSIEAGRLSVERGEHAVGPLIEQAVSMLQRVAEEKAITVETRLPDVLPGCECDDQRVVQVLTNLIGNAVKFADRGGRVVVSAVPSGDEVLVSVADNGPGIPAADLPHVFTRFYRSRRTARTKGTGLGLAIAEGIVRAHGGRIWVESTVGEGSTFHFTLPRSSAAGHRRDAGARELRIVS
jgi:signal transduction histidine kinase